LEKLPELEPPEAEDSETFKQVSLSLAAENGATLTISIFTDSLTQKRFRLLCCS
jgi:hypothetical protein